MKLGIISLGGKSALKIREASKKYFNEVDILNLKNFEIQINGSLKIVYDEEELKKYDCLYIRGSYRYALIARSITRALNKDVYIPIKPKAYTIGHDKFLTLLELQKEGIPIPKTHYASTTKVAKKILDKVDFPVMMKLSEGTHGKGVMIAESKKSALTILDLLEDFHKPYLIQEFIETKNTSDIRVIVSKKKVLAAYKRVAMKGEIRANIHSGGTRKYHKLTKEEEELAIRSAEAIGANICGVDILNAKNPSVIEINLSPAVAELKEICKIDVPDLIARELYNQTKKFKKRQKEKFKKKLKN
jgi:ribosomal protein S6--L-glutamate ligase